MHMSQLMPLPFTVSCFSKIQIGFTFLVPARPGSPRQRAIKRVCVCVCVSLVLAAVCFSAVCMWCGRCRRMTRHASVCRRMPKTASSSFPSCANSHAVTTYASGTRRSSRTWRWRLTTSSTTLAASEIRLSFPSQRLAIYLTQAAQVSTECTAYLPKCKSFDASVQELSCQ